MQRDQHTPGPWRTEHETSAGHDLWALYAGDRYIGHYTHDGDRHIPYVRPNREAEANAHLIAAAPEMLEALRAEGGPDAMEQTAFMLEGDYPNTARWLRQIASAHRAAIAKATGKEG